MAITFFELFFDMEVEKRRKWLRVMWNQV